MARSDLKGVAFPSYVKGRAPNCSLIAYTRLSKSAIDGRKAAGYQPTDRPDRGHVGKNWTRYQLRSMQIILQATHGVVSGAPEFFKRAFGNTVDEFERILLLPHDFIFNRDWFERLGGRGEFDEYNSVASRLDTNDRVELVNLLSSCDPSGMGFLGQKTENVHLKHILPFYVPKAKNDLFQIWNRQQNQLQESLPGDALAEDERVEDAGLDQDEVSLTGPGPHVDRSRTSKAAA